MAYGICVLCWCTLHKKEVRGRSMLNYKITPILRMQHLPFEMLALFVAVFGAFVYAHEYSAFPPCNPMCPPNMTSAGVPRYQCVFPGVCVCTPGLTSINCTTLAEQSYPSWDRCDCDKRGFVTTSGFICLSIVLLLALSVCLCALCVCLRLCTGMYTNVIGWQKAPAYPLFRQRCEA